MKVEGPDSGLRALPLHCNISFVEGVKVSMADTQRVRSVSALHFEFLKGQVPKDYDKKTMLQLMIFTAK